MLDIQWKFMKSYKPKKACNLVSQTSLQNEEGRVKEIWNAVLGLAAHLPHIGPSASDG